MRWPFSLRPPDEQEQDRPTVMSPEQHRLFDRWSRCDGAEGPSLRRGSELISTITHDSQIVSALLWRDVDGIFVPVEVWPNPDGQG